MGNLKTLALIGGGLAVGFGLFIRKLNRDIEEADRRLGEALDNLHSAEREMQDLINNGDFTAEEINEEIEKRRRDGEPEHLGADLFDDDID
tara:strand:- start:34903 stop:35175 length:273 start_codon:yes stop_codon:yes gene_type:complete